MDHSFKYFTNQIIIVLIYLMFLQPAYFNIFPVLDAVSNILRVTIFIVLTIYFIVNKKISPELVCTAAYTVFPLLMTILSRGKIYPAFRIVVLGLGILMWSEYLGKRHPKLAIESLTFLLEVLVYANILTIVLVPKGLFHYTTATGWTSDKCWLLGLRNGHIPYLLLGCFCSGLRYYYSKKQAFDKFRLILMHIVAVLTIYLLESGGGYVAFTAYFLMLIGIRLFKKVRIDFSVAIVFHVVLFFAITVFSATLLFTDFFALFGKNGTATGRIYLWATMWKHIAEKPVFGHGYMNDKDLMWLQFAAAGATTGHNAMIDMMFRGGFVTLVLFVLLLFSVRKKLRFLSQDKQIYNYAVISFIALFLPFQSEGGMDSTILFSMIGLLSILPKINLAAKLKK